MFSRRVPADLEPNALARLRSRLGGIPYDLTLSNPTLCRIPYPEALLEPLGSADGLVYRPEPNGIGPARAAIAEEYAADGIAVDPDAVCLTASTSEAYSFLFKLLCDPADTVLIPSPSYPLFEHLARLDGLSAVPYALDASDGWQPHLPREGRVRPRAVVCVHPNNPTGSYLGAPARAAVAEYCAANGAALIVDEVFQPFALDPAERAPSFAQHQDVLTFTLNGLSKYVGLPQLKLAWIVVSGPAAEVAQAVERLAFLADNYLSVGTPVQLALRALLREGASVRHEIRRRCGENLSTLQRALAGVPELSLSRPEGGWSAVFRFPNVLDEEALALELLGADGVAVQPGYFFDFPAAGYLSLSLLPPPDIFAAGLRRVLDRIRGRLSS